MLYAQILLHENPSDALRLINLTKSLLENIQNVEHITGLLLRQISTYELEFLEEELLAPVNQYLQATGQMTQMKNLLTGFENLRIVINDFETQEKEEFNYSTDTNVFLSFSPENTLHVDYINKVLKQNTHEIIKTNKKYHKYESIIKNSKLEKSLESYNKLLTLYQTQTRFKLPSVINTDNTVNYETMKKNKQVIYDYYQNHVKSKISKEDATFIEERKSHFFKNKTRKEKGLNFLTRSVRYFFSEKKDESDDDFWLDENLNVFLENEGDSLGDSVGNLNMNNMVNVDDFLKEVNQYVNTHETVEENMEEVILENQ
jgi:hypothetical protein